MSRPRANRRFTIAPRKLLVALVTLLGLFATTAAPAGAQTYIEPRDYQLLRATFPGGAVRPLNWNIAAGGATNIPYYVNTQVINAGFLPAVLSAFATMQNDPSSNISFRYMGATSALSEWNLGVAGGPNDGINVVSFGPLSGGIGRGGPGFSWSQVDSTGYPTNGAGQFDITMRSGVNWTTVPSGSTVDFESVVLHELGHAMGLDHPTGNSAAVMHVPLINGTSKRVLHPADRAGLAIMYPQDGFGDVPPGAYYAEAVEWAKANNITTGTTAYTFSPNAAVTRAQMATFLWRYRGQPSAGPHPFTDVPNGQYYTNAVRWLAESGITTGLTATTFGPNFNVNRAQMAAFLWRYSNEPPAPPASGPGGFSDVTPGQYYDIAVGWMAQEGITTGTTATTYSPNRVLTRAQAVTFLWRHAGSPLAADGRTISSEPLTLSKSES